MSISRNTPPGIRTTRPQSGGTQSVSSAQPVASTTSNAASSASTSSAVLPPAPSAQLTTRAQTVKQALHFQDAGLDDAGKVLKYDRLSSSVFSFFRGTGRLFYTDMTQVDCHMPKPLCNGDAHPENFGVMPGDDGKLAFGLNDFDEAASAPFTWDLQRALVGFALVAEQNALSDKDKKTAMKSLVKRYVKTLKKHNDNDKEGSKRITSDNAPKVVEHLFEKHQEGSFAKRVPQ
ncbi:MAG: DUF2252 domain-containing protein [Deltaproteobacteria bacterium]|nr:DUF2252 domain-containing protein [Deltaproteobacteria bacterium]